MSEEKARYDGRLRKTWIDKNTGETLTYEINIKEAFKEFVKNKEFKKYLETGNFIYRENRFVINHPKYVTFDKEGRAKLTDYAKKNGKECFVVFKLVDGERDKEVKKA